MTRAVMLVGLVSTACIGTREGSSDTVLCDADAELVGSGRAAGDTGGAKDTSPAEEGGVLVVAGSDRSAVILGEAQDDGSHAQLDGTYWVRGLPTDAPLTVSMVNGDCSATACAGTMTIYLATTGARIDLFSPADGPCGSVTLDPDPAGVLKIEVDPGSSGGDDNGVLVRW